MTAPLNGSALRLARRAGGALLAFAAVAVLSQTAGADTGAKLASARAQLSALEQQIAVQQRQVNGLQAQLRTLAVRVAGGQAEYDALAIQLIQAQDALAGAEATYRSVKDRLDVRARDLFMQGPAGTLDLVLGANSLTDLSDRLEVVKRVSQQDAALAATAQRLAGAMKDRDMALEGLLTKQAKLLTRLRTDQASLVTEFAEQQGALQALTSSRAQAAALVTKLARKLRADELAAARAAIGSGTPGSYGTWGGLFLQALGVPGCRGNMVVMVAWQTAEGARASFNPLDTTLPMPGATNFNSVGVKNYVSQGQGLTATVRTLTASSPSYGYGAIVAGLRACADAMVTAQAVNDSQWCHGCAGGLYVTELIPAVEAYYGTYAGR